MGLVAACHALGAADRAMAAARALLGRHALGIGGGMAATLSAIARAADLPGWAALRGDGTLVAHLLAPVVAAEDVRIWLDGRAIRARARVGGSPRALAWRLPAGWQRGHDLEATIAGTALLGCPIEVDRIVAVEGFVETIAGGLRGWAWSPNNAETDPTLRVLALAPPARAIEIVATDHTGAVVHDRPLARPRGFAVDARDLAGFDGLVRVVGRDGRDLTGSPLDPSAERHAAVLAATAIASALPAVRRVPARRARQAPIRFAPVPADIVGPPARASSAPRPVDVVIPVYRGAAATLACIETVLRDLPDWARLVVVDDRSPERGLAAALDDLAARQRIHLLRHTVNRGFPATANAGVSAGPDRDIALLNSDTLVPPGWLARLRAAAYAASDIGSVSPLSNNAAILSYPVPDRDNPMPDLHATIALDAIAAEVNASCAVELPTAVGFCMYLKRDCIDDVGALREDLFAQGYGEENDFSIRARHLGWRHVAACDVFVAHAGATSFAAASRYLLERNSVVLGRLHPGYAALIARFRAEDPLAPARRRMDTARWAAARDGGKARLIIGDAGAGDRPRRPAAACSRLIRLLPDHREGELGCRLDDPAIGPTPALRFALPGDIDALVDMLRDDRLTAIDIHSLADHDPVLAQLPARLGVAHDVVVGDYSWFCPRIDLLGVEERYCGEPDAIGCEHCVADAGNRLASRRSVREWRAVSRAVLAQAARIAAPSQDAARRLRRHFPAAAAAVAIDEPVVAPDGPVLLPDGHLPALLGRICVLGADSLQNGYEVVLAMARDAAWRSLPIEYVIVGESIDDARLLATGRAFVTGPPPSDAAIDLIRAQRAAFAFLPMVVPDPVAAQLDAAWAAGLDATCFDLGTTAERIRRAGRGWLLPLGVPAPAINNRLLGVMREIAQRGREVAHG